MRPRSDGSAAVAPAPSSLRDRPRTRARARAPGTTGLWVVCTACAAAVAAGWWTRDELYVVPESGLGYALGVAGLAIMACLPLYSLRKRLGFMRSWGTLRQWFRPHMAMGVVGPTAILFHCNFSFGSLNSNVALISMLIVSGSGFAGRFLYSRIHHVLTGRRRTLQEVQSQANSGRRALEKAFAIAPSLDRILRDFEGFALASQPASRAGSWRFPRLARRARATREQARRSLRRAALANRRPIDRNAVDRAVRVQLRAVRRVASFTAWERLFGLWHALHVPLCVILFVSAALHVFAVHMY